MTPRGPGDDPSKDGEHGHGPRYLRALRTLSECARVMVRAGSEQALVEQICRVLVELGGYRLSWIGYMHGDGSVRPVAQAGFMAGFLDTHVVSWRGGSPTGHGVVGTCIRTRAPAVIHDAGVAERYRPWHRLAQEYGFSTVLGLPLIVDGAPMGAMAFYSVEIDAFDAEEVELLREVADDLSYGIYTRRLQLENERAHAALHTLNQELEARVARRTRDLEAARQALEEDIRRREQVERELRASNQRLEQARDQLIQSEKMAAIGQLAAGVAHEINNPIGYVHSNLNSLARYVDDLLSVADAFERAEARLPDELGRQLRAEHGGVDLRFIKEDLHALLRESREGIDRVKKIVQDLKEFSHMGSGDWQLADLHHSLETTLNIARSHFKTRAEVIRRYGELPRIECLPSQLNQVFMNLLVNAAQAIEGTGRITLTTGHVGEEVFVEVQDTGCGIPEEHLSRVFDAFFTTKPVGQGTGLGLPLTYSIVQKHHGRIEVESRIGEGTCFRVWLPIRQPADT